MLDAVESAGLAGGAVVVSAGAGAAGGGVVTALVVVAELVAESVVEEDPLPLPQDITKRLIERASTLNFTNFIIMFFLVGYRFILKNEKGNPAHCIFFKKAVCCAGVPASWGARPGCALSVNPGFGG